MDSDKYFEMIVDCGGGEDSKFKKNCVKINNQYKCIIYIYFLKFNQSFVPELLKLAKNATLNDVLDEIKKNRKFSKNEALFCKQQETEKIDGAKKFVEMFPWILTFNRFHIKTLCKHDSTEF